MSRRLTFAANWKMHHGPQAARAFADRFLELVPARDGRELWIFPPAASLSVVADAARGRADLKAGAQNVYWEPKGAFTGEVSIPIIREAGARGALVGHSERRHVFGETDEDTRRKVRAILDGGLTAMLCVGEKLDERESGRTSDVVLRQLRAGLEGLDAERLGRIMIAYEPVWAIGTGRNATPQDAATVHAVIRDDLERLGAPGRVPILYGGSVNLGNALSLLAEEELDGVLVGGASLEADAWAELVGIGA
ncbi:MAG TPA: triose-phosphate isomerase [Gemmatimonadales bacterium]|nr:triose-phosphate isomerase [Gemmatimonadales bacterium]